MLQVIQFINEVRHKVRRRKRKGRTCTDDANCPIRTDDAFIEDNLQLHHVETLLAIGSRSDPRLVEIERRGSARMKLRGRAEKMIFIEKIHKTKHSVI